MHGFQHASPALAAGGRGFPGPASQHLGHLTTGQAMIAALVITLVLFLITEGVKAAIRGSVRDRARDR